MHFISFLEKKRLGVKSRSDGASAIYLFTFLSYLIPKGLHKSCNRRSWVWPDCMIRSWSKRELCKKKWGKQKQPKREKISCFHLAHDLFHKWFISNRLKYLTTPYKFEKQHWITSNFPLHFQLFFFSYFSHTHQKCRIIRKWRGLWINSFRETAMMI